MKKFSVSVNDLGGSATGEGAAKSMADQVVDEIRATGGKAVANYGNIKLMNIVRNYVKVKMKN